MTLKCGKCGALVEGDDLVTDETVHAECSPEVAMAYGSKLLEFNVIALEHSANAGSESAEKDDLALAMAIMKCYDHVSGAMKHHFENARLRPVGA